MIVHICCSVDSHYFLEKLRVDYPDEELIGYFYDPNIHPYHEYKLRFLDVEYSCNKLGIELIEGPYDIDNWLEQVKGLEQEPEKGSRCTVCFDYRLENTALKAKELGHDKFTTTLLMSPKKSQEKLENIGKELSLKHEIEFVFKDYRSGMGSLEQGVVVKTNGFYRQNYCGCLFGLEQQRAQQGKLMDEMFLPISNQILPESIESRIELYKKRNELNAQGIPFKIIKQKFLNYRLLSGKVMFNKETIPSYFLCYSKLGKGKMSGRIEYEKDDISYLNKDEVKILSLDIFNDIGGFTYRTMNDLIFNPPTFQAELNLRNTITRNPYGLSAIVIVEQVEDGKYDITMDAKIYEDIKEVII